MPFIDFAELKNRMTIEQIVSMLGLEMKQAGQQLRGCCPACKTTGGRELVVTPSKGAWYCFSEKRGGDLIALAAHIKGISVKEAAGWLAGGTVNTSTSTVQASDPKPAEKVPQRGFDREKYRAGLERTHELLKDIPADLIERADIGVSKRGTHPGLINVPLYDKDTGDFICYAGVPRIQLPRATVTPLKKAS